MSAKGRQGDFSAKTFKSSQNVFLEKTYFLRKLPIIIFNNYKERATWSANGDCLQIRNGIVDGL